MKKIKDFFKKKTQPTDNHTEDANQENSKSKKEKNGKKPKWYQNQWLHAFLMVILVLAALIAGILIGKLYFQNKANVVSDAKYVDTHQFEAKGVRNLQEWYAAAQKNPAMLKAFDALHPGKREALMETIRREKAGENFGLTLDKDAKITNTGYRKNGTWFVMNGYTAKKGTAFLKLYDGTIVIKQNCGNVVKFPAPGKTVTNTPVQPQTKAPRNSSPKTTPHDSGNPSTQPPKENVAKPTDCYVTGTAENAQNNRGTGTNTSTGQAGTGSGGTTPTGTTNGTSTETAPPPPSTPPTPPPPDSDVDGTVITVPN